MKFISTRSNSNIYEPNGYISETTRGVSPLPLFRFCFVFCFSSRYLFNRGSLARCQEIAFLARRIHPVDRGISNSYRANEGEADCDLLSMEMAPSCRNSKLLYPKKWHQKNKNYCITIIFVTRNYILIVLI